MHKRATDGIMAPLNEFGSSQNMFHFSCHFTQKIQDAQELQKFLQMVLLSDSDGDFILSDEEMDRFTMKLQCYSVVDQERLKQALRLCSVTNVNGDLYKTQQQERDLEIVSAGALSGVQGWMV